MPRGGKRAGAGRPATGAKQVASFTLSDEAQAKLAEIAQQQGTSKSGAIESMITAEHAKEQLQQAWARFDEQQADEQRAGDSVGAFWVCYWQKVVKLTEKGIPIPAGATDRQIAETPIDTIESGYLYCCDHANPNGYNSIIRIDFIGKSKEEIERIAWAEYALKEFGKYRTPHESVNDIRHNLTPYDAWRRDGMDYLTAFMKANLMIAKRIPSLAKPALEQIEHKRKELQKAEN